MGDVIIGGVIHACIAPFIGRLAQTEEISGGMAGHEHDGYPAYPH